MTSNRNISLIHPVMYPGEIRRHYLLQGEIAVFYGFQPKETAKEVNLNMKAFRGFPEMYYDECETFPNCQYNADSLIDKINPYPSNRMTVYSFYLDNDDVQEEEEEQKYDNYNPINSFQPVMIVYCSKGGKREKTQLNDQSSLCEFDTLYFSNEDSINIYEGSAFSQYLLKNETDKYKINLINEDNVNKIYLDLLIFSGDVKLNVNNINQNNVNKYYLSNKIYYTIQISSSNKEIEFEVTGQRSSFYMVEYLLVKQTNSNINIIDSGINYISSVGINTDKSKVFQLNNFKYEFQVPYLVTFYSQNSQFTTKKLSSILGDGISSSDNYAQYIIDSNDKDYDHEYFKFELDITNNDKTKDNSKVYMIYVAGLELSDNFDDWNGRAISLSEGVPHKYIFTKKYPFIYYAYHMSDYSY